MLSLIAITYPDLYCSMSVNRDRSKPYIKVGFGENGG